MKKIFLYILFSCIFFTISATDVSLVIIKNNILAVLRETGDISEKYAIENLPNNIIFDRKNNRPIQQGLNGVFYIPRFSAHGCAHYLLIDNKKVQVVNMRNPLVANLKIFMDFFKQNKDYTKDDVLFYISDFITTYNTNEKRMDNEGIHLEE